MFVEIIATIILLAGLAKHPRRRRKFRAYLRGRVHQKIPIGTLGAATLVAQALQDSVTEKAFVTSIVATWALSNVTPSGSGPLLVGVAHGDYTAAEIEAFIENSTSWDRGDLITQEVNRRKIKIVGVFDEPTSADDEVRLQDGRMIKTKLNWVLETGQSLDLWAYNRGSVAYATTTPSVAVDGHCNIWPM